jgi:hypothetical protein
MLKELLFVDLVFRTLYDLLKAKQTLFSSAMLRKTTWQPPYLR